MSKSDNQNIDGMVKGINTEFYAKDKLKHPGRFVRRRFKDPLHFLHNLFDLLMYMPDLIRVYFGRAIPPDFRELIMLTVAGANDCNV